MADPTIVRPALLVYAFAALDGTPDSAQRAWRRLDRLWLASRVLGSMTEPMLGATAPERLPELPGQTGAFRIVASARRSTVDRMRSMFVFTEHGTAGLIAALAADADGVAGWTELISQWSAATRLDSDHDLLSMTLVLIGLTPDPGLLADVGSTGVRLVQQSGGGVNLTHSDQGPGSALIWRLDRASTGSQMLVIAALEHEEGLIDEWAWARDGRQGLMPLTRYCLSISRADHQRRLYQALQPIAKVIAETDDATAALMAELRRERRQELDAAALLLADQRVHQVQAARPGLLWRMTRIQEMAATVRALQANARRNRPLQDDSSAPTDIFVRDDAELAWFLDQLDREAVYLDALTRRADSAHAAAASAITAAVARRRERITLLQTSFLGALLMALAAIQTFQSTTPIDSAIKLPLISTLAAAAFGLPFLAARWSGLTAKADPYRWPDVLAAAVVGAALSWLLSTIMWIATAKRLAPPLGTGAAVTLGTLLLAGSTWWLAYRSRNNRFRSTTSASATPPSLGSE